MRQHISATISDELLQAARMDGANSWQIFLRIAFPVVRPAAAVLGLLGFVNAWNDFLWPFIVLKSPDMYTRRSPSRRCSPTSPSTSAWRWPGPSS